MSTYDPTDLRGQEVIKSKSDDLQKRRLQIEIDDLKWLMSNKKGRRIVWRLLERTGLYRSSFTGNSETFFREGERNIGLMLMLQINEHCPGQYAVMVQEQKSDRDADDGYRKQP